MWSVWCDLVDVWDWTEWIPVVVSNTKSCCLRSSVESGHFTFGKLCVLYLSARRVWEGTTYLSHIVGLLMSCESRGTPGYRRWVSFKCVHQDYSSKWIRTTTMTTERGFIWKVRSWSSSRIFVHLSDPQQLSSDLGKYANKEVGKYGTKTSTKICTVLSHTKNEGTIVWCTIDPTSFFLQSVVDEEW